MSINVKLRTVLLSVYNQLLIRVRGCYNKLRGTALYIRLFAAIKITLYLSAAVKLIYFILFSLTPLVGNYTSGFFYSSSAPESAFFTGKKKAENHLRILKRETEQMQRNLRRLIPASNYLVVNTTENKIYLYSGGKMIHEGICSTGSYTLLKAGADQEWIFKTPKGMFTIHGKAVSPVWRKPDWAFIEEGLPVPPANSHLRFEAGVLGDYALSLGGGYLIHGTLFQRFLGLPVTHGCIRLGDEDLKKVYHTLDIGSRVYIY